MYQDEGHLGRDNERPGFKKMMDDIGNGEIKIDAVLVLTTSRLFRNVQAAINCRVYLRLHGVRLITVSSEMDVSDDGATTMLAAFSQFDMMMNRHSGTTDGDDDDPDNYFGYNDSLAGDYGDGLLILDSEITIEIDYPVSGSFRFPVQSEGGFTKKGLFNAIKSVYEHVYEVEAATSSVQSCHCPPLCNRNTTDGQYGIRCHDLGDLYLEGVHYDPIEKVAYVVVGS